MPTISKREAQLSYARPFLSALVLAVLAACTPPCRADLIVEVPNVLASPGTTGSFDVLLTNTGPSSFDAAAFNLELSLAGPPGIHFTDATINTATPYIFQVSSGPPLSFSTFPNTDFIASDAEFASPFFDTITSGQTVGLAHVLFSVDADAPPGSGTIDVVTSDTLITDANLDGIIPKAVDGTFTVVPEPSTLALLGLGLIALARWRWTGPRGWMC